MSEAHRPTSTCSSASATAELPASTRSTFDPEQQKISTASNHRVNAYEKKDPDIETELFEHLTIKATDFGGDTESRLYQLLVKQDKVNGQAIKVSLDRGADHNAIRQGFATEVARRKKAVAERFDGTTTTLQ